MSSGNAPFVYQYSSSPQADAGAMAAIGGIPAASAATGYNPASTVAQGQSIINAEAGLPQYAMAALQAGYDPQHALYTQGLNTNTQQALAAEAAAGVAGTPYGAGLTNQANTNYNLGWDSQALARMASGAGTAQGLLGEYGAGTALGSGLQQAGGQYATGINQLQATDYMNYLQGGTQASNAAVNSYNAQQNASNSLWGGIGNLAGTLLTAPTTGGGSLLGNFF